MCRAHIQLVRKHQVPVDSKSFYLYRHAAGIAFEMPVDLCEVLDALDRLTLYAVPTIFWDG